MRRKWALAALAGTLAVAALLSNEHVEFMAGGALINAGYRLQDRLEKFDFIHHEDISPQEVWDEMVAQNEMSAAMRRSFPRTARHPLVAVVACMDARIDTNELTGDSRKYYYIIRTAGSVLAEKEEEMLELAVENGVKVVVITTHTDCAAEKAAASPEQRLRFPTLVKAIDERDARIAELLARPAIASRIADGKLLVKVMNIDTATDKILPR